MSLVVDQPEVVARAFGGDFSQGAWEVAVNASILAYLDQSVCDERFRSMGWKTSHRIANGVHAVVARPISVLSPKVGIVAWEGSNPSIDDWERNFNASLVPSRNTPCKSHRGYMEGVGSLWSWLRSAMSELKASLLVGHSAGGGLATEQALSTKTRRLGGKSNLACYTFAAPPTLNRQAREYLAMTMGGQHYNTTNALDLVKFAGAFRRHAGTTIYINDRNFFFNPSNPVGPTKDRLWESLSYRFGERVRDHDLIDYARTMDNLFGLVHTDLYEYELAS